MSAAMEAPASEATGAPEPGVYRDTPPAEYHGWPYASRSMLTKLADTRHYTPADVLHEVQTEKPDSDALALGEALHVAVLEPNRYDEAVALGPVNPRTGKTFGRGTGEWRKAEADDNRALLTTDQAARIPCMVAALRSNPRAQAVFTLTAERELSVVVDLDLGEIASDMDLPFWPVSEEDTMLRVKARLDVLGTVAPGVGLVADLKTTQARTEWELQESIMKYGYLHQAVLYPLLARAAGLGNIEHFALVVVRSVEPYRAAVLRVSEDSQRIAWQELLPAMSMAAQCYRTGEWPAWRQEVLDIGAPEWKLRQIERY